MFCFYITLSILDFNANGIHSQNQITAALKLSLRKSFNSFNYLFFRHVEDTFGWDGREYEILQPELPI